MEIVKKEIDAIKEVSAKIDEHITHELMDLQLAMIAGGTTDVTFV